MSFKQVTTSDVITGKLQLEKLYRDTVKATFLAPLIGKQDERGSVIVHETELGKKKGDKITVNNLEAVDAKKVIKGGTTALRGQSQSLASFVDSVTIDQYDLPVSSKTKGSIDKQRGMFEIDETAKAQLMKGAPGVIDDMLFTALYLSPTRTVYGGTATSTATLTVNDKLTPQLITFLETIARGGDRDASDNRVYEPLEPIMVDGKQYLLFMTDWNTYYDFRRNNEYLQTMREAELRGSSNPIFKWADAVWGNVIVKVADRTPTSLTGGVGSDVPYSKSMLLGANALMYADAGNPEIVEDWDKIDKIMYYNWTALMGAKKVQFNGKDRGCIQVIVARSKVLDRAL